MGHNLLLRLSTQKQDVLRFLTNPSVPFTNNLAERDGRMMKLRQKISGGFRSADGAKDFAVRSVLSTARKQRSCMLHTLERRTGAPDGRAALGVTALTTWVVTYFGLLLRLRHRALLTENSPGHPMEHRGRFYLRGQAAPSGSAAPARVSVVARSCYALALDRYEPSPPAIGDGRLPTRRWTGAATGTGCLTLILPGLHLLYYPTLTVTRSKWG